MHKLSRRVVGQGALTILGRKKLYRLSQFLLHRARFDVENDIGSNGELEVQRTVLNAEPQTSPLVIFDIGANIGLWSAALMSEAAARHRNIRLHAFEPCTETFRLLERLTSAATDGVEFFPVHKACSSREGVADLNIAAGGACGVNSMVPRTGIPRIATEQIELTTIDSYCAQQNIPRIDLVKIDAEGHDLEVMRGALGMIGRKAISAIQFEYNECWIFARSYLRDAFELLNAFQLRLGKITPQGIEFYDDWTAQLETFCEGNYLAATEDWAGRFKRVEPSWL